jgi:hypothetical protein
MERPCQCEGTHAQCFKPSVAVNVGVFFFSYGYAMCDIGRALGRAPANVKLVLVDYEQGRSR